MANKKDEKFTDFFAVGLRLFGQSNPIALIYLLLAIVFSGTEACKIIFRHKFAKNTVGIRQIITFSLLLLGWVFFCYFYKPKNDSSHQEEELMLTISTIFYSVLGFSILIKGILDWNKSENKGGGTILGESTLLGFLKDSGWTELRIRNTAEPLLILAIATPVSLINIFLGVPLLFLGISVWLFNAFDVRENIENAVSSPADEGETDENSQFPQ